MLYRCRKIIYYLSIFFYLKIIYNINKVDDNMKKVFILLFLLSFSFINIVFASEFKLNKEIAYNVNDIEKTYSSSKDYIVINKNKTIYKYNSKDNIIVSKEISDISNQNIIKFEKNFLLVGISSNTLKIYLLDNNLQVRNQIDTTDIVSIYTEFKLYEYNNKIYILLTSNNTLLDNNIIEVDQELNLSKKEFSSYEPTILKEILKSDYYLIQKNNEIEGDIINKYNSSINYLDKNILIGTNSNDKAILKILGEELIEKTYQEYSYFKNIEIINDEMYILTDHNIAVIDFNGKVVKEIPVNNIIEMKKLSDKIALISSDNKIIFYEYECNVEVIESDFGTISVSESNKAFDKVKIDVVPNSGFELEKIIVTDKENNIIEIKSNEFTMPTSDVSIEALYVAKVDNPDTADYIFVIVCISALAMLLLTKTHKKLEWLK